MTRATVFRSSDVPRQSTSLWHAAYLKALGRGNMTSANLQHRWHDLRRRTQIVRGSWLAAVVFGPGGGYLSSLLDRPWSIYGSAILAGMVLIAAFNYRLTFRCPGCDKHFVRFGLGSNSLARDCVDCGRKVGCTDPSIIRAESFGAD